MHVPTLPKLASGAALALTLLGIGACDNGPTDPGTTRFGQVGQIRVHVITPEPPGNGSLEQIMEWESDGPWNVTERISYRGQLGDENVQRLRIDLDTYASNYATVIAQLNENEGLKLFLDSLPPGEDPNCAADRTEVIEAQIERFAPGFRDLVLARHTTSAPEFEAYNPNWVGGAIKVGVHEVSDEIELTDPAMMHLSLPIDVESTCDPRDVWRHEQLQTGKVA